MNIYLRRIVEILYVIGAVSSGILMLVLFWVAFWEVGNAILVFFRITPGPDTSIPAESRAITMALKGIEYLFLAPMTFLVYRSVSNYIADRVLNTNNPKVDEELMETKSLVTSLMFAVVATDLIGKGLSPEGLHAKAPIYELGLLIVLAGYMFLLHLISSVEN